MEKKKRVIIVVAVLVVFVGIVSFICYKNRDTVKTPINRFVTAINHRDVNGIPKLYHEYCSSYIKRKLTEERFEAYINLVIDEVGENYKMSFEITDIVECSKEEQEEYEYLAKFDFQNEPYLSGGNNLIFEAVYKVTTHMINEQESGSIGGIKFKGNNKSEGDVEFTIVKIDGKYYFLDRECGIVGSIIEGVFLEDSKL